MNHDKYEGLARALFEEADEAQFLIDPETGQIVDANAAVQRLCRVSLRTILGVPIGDLLRGGDGARRLEFPMSAWRIELPYAEGGCLLSTYPGASVPVDVSVTRLIVSPRAVALLTVRESDVAAPPVGQNRLRRLLASVPACLWCVEVAAPDRGRFDYLSPSVRLIAGRPTDYFADQLQRWRDLIHPHDQAAWDYAWERRRAGNPTEVEYRLAWPDGSDRWVQDLVRVARSLTGSIWLYGVFIDATIRRQAERTWWFRAELVETADDAIIAQSLDGQVVDWNRSAEHLYGFTKEEMQDRPTLQLFEPDSLKSYVDAVRRSQRGERNEPYKATQIRKDGQRIEVSMRVSPIGDPASKPNGISVIARRIRPRTQTTPGQAGAEDVGGAGP